MSFLAELEADKRQANPCPLGILARTDPQLARDVLEALAKRGNTPSGFAFSARAISEKLKKQGHWIGRDSLAEHRDGPCDRCLF